MAVDASAPSLGNDLLRVRYGANDTSVEYIPGFDLAAA